MTFFGGRERRAGRRPARQALPGEETLAVDVDGAPVTVRLKRDPRARRLTLRLPTATSTPVVTVPTTTSTPEALRFLDRHEDWLAKRLAAKPSAVPFAAGARLPLRGVDHAIEHRPTVRGTVWREEGEGEPKLCVAGGAEFLARRLTDWLKREARADLGAAVTRHAARIERTVARISVRDTTSRWGSCSSSGRLSFSWRLVLAPPFVLDYVAAHEVAHLIEMNHSDRFWRLVDELCADTATARDWLRREGAALHAYGQADG